MNSKNTNFLKTLFWILFAAIINYGISFIITPFVTNTLGTEAYGFVSLANSFANYASIVTVAVNSIAARYITIEIHKGSIENARKYYTSLFVADIVLGIFILTITLLMVCRLEDFIVIAVDLQNDVKWLFILVMVNFCIMSTSTVFSAATLIKNRLDIAALFKLIGYIFEAIILYFIFSIKRPHVYYMGIGLIGASVTLLVLNYLYTKVHAKQLIMKKKYFQFEAIKEVFAKGIWYSINSLGNVLNSGLDLWVSNLLLSAFQMGELAIVKTVTTIATALYQLVAQPLQPLLLRCYAENDKEKITKIFRYGINVSGYFANIIFAFFAIYGIQYFKLWTPSQNNDLLYKLMMITLLGGVIEGTVTPLYYTYVLTLKNKIPCIITLVGGFLNVVSMYVLIQFGRGGLYCVVGTTTVIAWITNFIFNPLYSAHCLGLRKTVFGGTIFRNLIACTIMTIICKGISVVYYPTTWGSLIWAGVVCSVLGGVVHVLITFNRRDIEIIKKMILKKEA